MSYKHNNLMAMRKNYWDDEQSEQVQTEKQYFQQMLSEYQVFEQATLDDAKYVFFALPSIIIVKGYALGFMSTLVKTMILEFILTNKTQLSTRQVMKIQFRV